MHTFYSVELEGNSYQDDVCCGTYEECLAYLTEHDYKPQEDNGYVNRIAKFSTNSVDDSGKEYVLSSSEYDSFLKDHGLDFDEDFSCEEIIEDWAEDAEKHFHAQKDNPLLDSLCEKVSAEYKTFITDMQKQDTATAIESAYEIVWKDNIAQYFENENINLTETQCNALLSSKNTLDEIYEDFRDDEYATAYRDLNITIGDTADKIQISLDREREAHMNAPLILHDGQTARSLGEAGLKDYRESHKENRACAEAIIAAKKENTTYGDMPGVCYFEAAKTVDDVLKKGFPAERLGYVIASQVVRNQNYLDNPRIIDGRFTNKVKDWAIKTFSQQENFPFRNFEDCDITSAMHHTLVNSLAESFIDKQAELSKAAEKKPSVLDKADKTESIFEKKESISVEINGESVLCKIIADNRFSELEQLRESQNLGKAVFPNSNDHRDYAMVNVEIPDKDGAPEVVRLYAECNIEDVPGEGHFENKKGVCDRNDDGAKFVIDDEEASMKYLQVALEKCAEKVAAERGIEVPYRAPTMAEKKPSVLGEIGKIKAEQKTKETEKNAPQKAEKVKSNDQEL